jgi:hypothetical protein
MHADARGWDRSRRIGTALRGRLCDACREAPCWPRAHLRASACIFSASALSLSAFAACRTVAARARRGLAPGHGDVPHGAWAVSVAAAIGVLWRMMGEQVHGVLAQESFARWPPADGPGFSTVYGVLSPRFGPTRPWLAALPAWLWCMGFCRPG